MDNFSQQLAELDKAVAEYNQSTLELKKAVEDYARVYEGLLSKISTEMEQLDFVFKEIKKNIK